MFDLDGDGKITKQELLSVLAEDSVTRALGMKHVEMMIKEVDTNGDGVIDFDEFMAMMKKCALPGSTQALIQINGLNSQS